MLFWPKTLRNKKKGQNCPLCFLGLLVIGLIIFFEPIYYVKKKVERQGGHALFSSFFLATLLL